MAKKSTRKHVMQNLSYMLSLYHRYSAADRYLWYIVVDHRVYMYFTDKLPRSMFKVEPCSNKDSGTYGIRFRPTAQYKRHLIETGKATYIMTEAEFMAIAREDGKHINNGERFEKWATETLMGVKWEKDKIPFYVQGDIVLDGLQIQLKGEGATITNDSVLTNAKKALGY